MIEFDPFELEEKALASRVKRAARAVASRRGGAGKARKVSKRAGKRPEYDGDNDGFITNPLTGQDDIPWNKATETAEEAIAKFFGGKVPERRQTIGETAKPKPDTMPAAPEKRREALTGPPAQRVTDATKPMRDGAAPSKPEPVKPAKPSTAPAKPPKVGEIVQGQAPDGKPAERPPLPPAAPAAPTANVPLPAFEWPRHSDGKLKEVEELTDEEIETGARAWWDYFRATKDPAAEKVHEKLSVENMNRAYDRMMERRKAAEEEEEARTRSWKLFGRWYPHKGWRYPRESQHFEGAEIHGRLSGEGAGELEVINLDAILPGEDGFAVIGLLYDPDSDTYIEYDSADHPHRTVEDAMKYAEDVIDALQRGDESVDAFEPDKRPNPNQISEESSLPTTKPWQIPNRDNKPAKGKNGPLGEKARVHNPVPAQLEEARKLFAEKWADRRRTDNAASNIEFADDRITELRLLERQMWESAMQDYPGLEEAWSMSADEFARWAKKNGLVDSLSEGRDYHEELLALWDQLAADQEEIGGMITEINNAKTKMIEQWDERAEAGNPNYPYKWADSGLARYHD